MRPPHSATTAAMPSVRRGARWQKKWSLFIIAVVLIPGRVKRERGANSFKKFFLSTAQKQGSAMLHTRRAEAYICCSGANCFTAYTYTNISEHNDPG
jgi:hypothetical protein